MYGHRNMMVLLMAMLPILGAYAINNARPMLAGHLETSKSKIIYINYDYEGDTFIEEIKPDMNGDFFFSPDSIVIGATEISIFIDNVVFGAFIEKGKQVEMVIRGECAEFKGDNVNVNLFVNTLQRQFDIKRFDQRTREPFDYLKYSNLLENSKVEVLNSLNRIENPQLREEYAELANASYNKIKLKNLLNNGIKTDEQRNEVDSIKKMFDKNSNSSRKVDMIEDVMFNAMLFYDASKLNEGIVRAFQYIDSVLTNPKNRKSLYLSLADLFFRKAESEESVNDFMDGVAPYVSSMPIVKKRLNQKVDEFNSRVIDGSKLPANPKLIRPDGTVVTLEDILDGKYVYIDIWATWCGPCVKEIPNMKKLHKQFKDKPDFKLVSISMDTDHEEWREKINMDNPEWEQYRFDNKTSGNFLKALRVNSIPRFLYISPDKNFISKDAIRPSNEGIVDFLGKCLSSDQ